MKIQLFIDTANTNISVKNRLFLIENKKTRRQISPQRIDSIAITSNVTLNTAAIKLAANNDISIFIYDTFGQSVGEFRNSKYNRDSRLRYKQLIFMHQEEGKKWVKLQLELKTQMQLQNIARWIRENSTLEELKTLEKDIKSYIPKIKNANIDMKQINGQLMGYEGSIARQYYKAVNLILPVEYRFAQRSRRPGKDYYNVLINYIYGMTYNEVTRALHAAGLDVYCGTLHQNQFGETLVFDFIEAFRPIIDNLLIESCTDKLWDHSHFTQIEGGYKINSLGKKILFPIYADYMRKRINWQSKVTSIRNHFFLHAKRLNLEIEKYIKNVHDIL